MTEKIGEFSAEIIELLNLDVTAGTEIFIGETNRAHMKSRHPQDYEKYIGRIGKIICSPNYVGINGADGSVEFIKTFGKNIKVAVRISHDGEYYARSLYSVGESRVKNSVKLGQLKPLTKA